MIIDEYTQDDYYHIFCFSYLRPGHGRMRSSARRRKRGDRGQQELHRAIYSRAVDETATGTMSDHANMKTTIGGLDFTYGNFHDGLLDEIRISDTARSDNWISTSYNTMNDPTNFFNVGPEETAP